MKLPSTKVLVTFAVTLVMLSLYFAGAFLGLVPDTEVIKKQGRATLAEALAVRSVRHLANSELDILEEGLELLLERNSELRSAAVRRADGRVVIRAGEHEKFWDAEDRTRSIDSQITVPIMEAGRQWGQLELSFEPLRRSGWLGILDSPTVRFSLFLAVVGFLLLYLVLSKLLRQLDPSKAVPARVRSALDTLREGLLAVDLKGQIVLANHAFSEIAGMTPDALLGVKVERLPWQRAEDEARDDDGYPWDVTLQLGVPSSNTAIHFTDGESKRRTFLINCSPVMGGQGKHVGALVSLGDVTELEEKEIQLRLSKERAEAANRAKSEFLANMSHEIRTPMNAILGFTEMLQRGYARSEADSQNYLNTIHSSGKFLLELINDLLDLSKIEAGAMELEKGPCSIPDVAREVVNTLSVKASERAIALDLEVATPVPETVETDAMRLRQIITNLVGNAIKFTETGGVKVIVRYDSKAAPDQIVIHVSDTGIGMSTEQVEKIFDPFVQADRTIVRRFGGTGLGLSISQRFAKALGGGIDVTSTPGEGSVFSVRIATGSLSDVAIISPEDALRQVAAPEASEENTWNFSHAKVLVADDAKQNRDLLRLFLREHGLQIAEATNGQEAVEAASAQRFDMILMDLQMPVMNGVDATRTMRAAGIKTPILALTAHSLESVQEEISEAGFTEYVSKPVDMGKLVQRMAGILGAPMIAAASPSAAVESGHIQSRLPMDDPRYRVIIDEFLESLDERIDAMSIALEQGDDEELAKLAHKLRGVAGSVGFDQFTRPIRALESALSNGERDELRERFNVVRALAKRVLGAPDAPAEVPEPERPAPVAELPRGQPIRSSLRLSDPEYRRILLDFIGELDGRFDAMEQAAQDSDFTTVGRLAHAFIGVASFVGFSEFTQPTRRLEAAAQSSDRMSALDCIVALRALAARVESPAPVTETVSDTDVRIELEGGK